MEEKLTASRDSAVMAANTAMRINQFSMEGFRFRYSLTPAEPMR